MGADIMNLTLYKSRIAIQPEELDLKELGSIQLSLLISRRNFYLHAHTDRSSIDSNSKSINLG